MFVYPKNNQSRDQQLIDESACYDTVGQQTGINPEAGGPQAPSSADVAAAEQQGAADAVQSSGGRVRGAGKGARCAERRLARCRGTQAGGLQLARALAQFEAAENKGKPMRLLRRRVPKRQSCNSSRRMHKVKLHTTNR
jgi:hypothetical protein